MDYTITVKPKNHGELTQQVREPLRKENGDYYTFPTIDSAASFAIQWGYKSFWVCFPGASFAPAHKVRLKVAQMKLCAFATLERV